MSNLQKEYGPRGFQAVGVAFNPMANLLTPEYMKMYATTYPVGFAPLEKVHEYLQVPETFRLMVPQIVYIDRSGTIRAQSPALGDTAMLEEKNIRTMIENLLKEPAGSARKKAAPAKKKSS